MAGITIPAKMKRKDLEDVSDELSLSAPATKMRRLDADLPPIMEEQGPAYPSLLVSEQLIIPTPQHSMMTGASAPGLGISVAEDTPLNEERALVLYRPVCDPCLHYPRPSPSYKLSSEVLSGLKNQALWWQQGGNVSPANLVGNQTASAGNCLAVIPWQAPATGEAGLLGGGELMDAAEVESMEVEEEEAQVSGGAIGDEGCRQWPQHCMTAPQSAPNTSATPIMWSS